MTNILVVDDIEANREVLSRRLKGEGFEIIIAEDGLIALDRLKEHAIDLVLLDIQMPNLDGFGVLEQMKSDEKFRHIPVIIVSALDDMDSVVRCIELGADDYLTKPFNKTLLRARVGASLDRKRLHDREEEHRALVEQYNQELEMRVKEQVGEIVSAQHASILAMSKLAESKDPDTGEHLDRMREYCKVISQVLGKLDKFKDIIDKKYIETIHAASPLHDIGKVGIPDPILLKPGKLSDDEWVIMKMHPSIGAETLRTVDKKHPGNALIVMGIEIAECHHERWDGKGYPHGLSGEDIPLAARILALGDVYDALTSKRCYKDAFTHEKSAEIIAEGKGTQFDPDVVDAFLAAQDEFIRIRKEFHDPDESGTHIDGQLKTG
ncbi:MAG: response regulator [Gammaproteobacteria bacterium]|nr:response regulator [Gammaproteobacteria bacterium]MDH5729757.1 response regulator [Gammaproteobacteria bacterium]